MAQRKIRVRMLPPNKDKQTDWQMFARNLATGHVLMTPVADVDDPYKQVIWDMLPGAWVDPVWSLDHDTNCRAYTVEV